MTEIEDLREQVRILTFANQQLDASLAAARGYWVKAVLPSHELYENGRPKMKAEVIPLSYIIPEKRDKIKLVMDVMLQPINYIISGCCLVWDNYSLRVDLPLRVSGGAAKERAGRWGTAAAHDIFARTVLRAAVDHIRATMPSGHTFETYLGVPDLYWPHEPDNIDFCLRVKDAGAFKKHFALVSDTYGDEKTLVQAAITNAQLAATLNSENLILRAKAKYNNRLLPNVKPVDIHQPVTTH